MCAEYRTAYRGCPRAIVRADVAVPVTIEPLSEEAGKTETRGSRRRRRARLSRRAPLMVVALDRPSRVARRPSTPDVVPSAWATVRLFSPPERARWLARRTAQLARLAQVADAQRVG